MASATQTRADSPGSTHDRPLQLQIYQLEKQVNYYYLQLQQAEAASRTYDSSHSAAFAQELDRLRAQNFNLSLEVRQLQRYLNYSQSYLQSSLQSQNPLSDYLLRDKIAELEQLNASYRKDNQQLTRDNQKLVRLYSKSQGQSSPRRPGLSADASAVQYGAALSESLPPPRQQQPLPSIQYCYFRTVKYCEKCKECQQELLQVNQQLKLYDDAFRQKKLEYLSMFQAFKKLKNQARDRFKLMAEYRDQALAAAALARQQLLDQQRQYRREMQETTQKLRTKRTKQADQEGLIKQLQQENADLKTQAQHLALRVSAFEQQQIRQGQIQDMTSKLRLENEALKKNIASAQYEYQSREKQAKIKSLADSTEISRLEHDNDELSRKVQQLENESLKSQRIIKLEEALRQYDAVQQAGLQFMQQLEQALSDGENGPG